jgi:RNA polymerase sigma-70 factor (ECF subfamily)
VAHREVAPDERRSRFERLYSTTYDPIVGYVLRRSSDQWDASDAVAETYLILWRRLDEAPSDDGRVLPWLYGVARRVLANQRRGERRRSALAARLATDVGDLTTYIDEPADETGQQIARALEQLGAEDREILELLVWEELGREEIALALGISRALVRLRLHRARQRFAQKLVAEGIDLKRSESAGHETERRASARPDTEEATP